MDMRENRGVAEPGMPVWCDGLDAVWKHWSHDIAFRSGRQVTVNIIIWDCRDRQRESDNRGTGRT